jgi:signal transduction histidine kinase
MTLGKREGGGDRAAASGAGGRPGRSRRRLSEIRLRKLIEATDVMLNGLEQLGGSRNVVLRQVGEAVVPSLADAARIDLLGPDGAPEPPILIFAGGSGEGQEWADLADSDWDAVKHVLSSGTPLLIRSSDQLSLPIGISGLDQAPVVGPEQVLVLAPLTVRGRCAGALTLASAETVRRYTSADLAFAKELARRIAAVLEREELLELTEAGTRWRQEILGIVAHELRNSLSTIAITAESLRMGWQEGDLSVPEARSTGERQLELVVGAVHRMKKFVSDLLDSVQLESGKLAVNVETVPLGRLLEAAVETHQSRAERLDVQLDLISSSNLFVEADEHRIVQVISNLVDNALKWTPPGGCVRVRAVAEGDEARVEVRDTGMGIPPGELQNIFSTKWRPRRSREGGYGLGLVIARLIVSAHGGRIGVESEEGVGSTFYFTVPLAGYWERFS